MTRPSKTAEKVNIGKVTTQKLKTIFVNRPDRLCCPSCTACSPTWIVDFSSCREAGDVAGEGDSIVVDMLAQLFRESRYSSVELWFDTGKATKRGGPRRVAEL